MEIKSPEKKDYAEMALEECELFYYSPANEKEEEEFLLCYVNDRSFMDILISSKVEPSKWFALSFVKDLIDNNMINADEKEMDNYTRIEELNKFLKNKFNLINELFNKKNYPITKMKIDEGLKQQFNLKFPR